MYNLYIVESLYLVVGDVEDCSVVEDCAFFVVVEDCALTVVVESVAAVFVGVIQR